VEATPVDEMTLEDVHRPVRIFEIIRADLNAPASVPRVF
jgi:hypothetical protein